MLIINSQNLSIEMDITIWKTNNFKANLLTTDGIQVHT